METGKTPCDDASLPPLFHVRDAPCPRCILSSLLEDVQEIVPGAKIFHDSGKESSSPSSRPFEPPPSPRFFQPFRKPEINNQDTRITIPRSRRWWVPILRKNSEKASIISFTPVSLGRRSLKCPRPRRKNFRLGNKKPNGQLHKRSFVMKIWPIISENGWGLNFYHTFYYILFSPGPLMVYAL